MVDIKFILENYGHLIEDNSVVTSDEFANLVKDYYSIHCYHNFVVYEFLKQYNKTIQKTKSSFKVY
jgi:hypothetical protein